MPTKPLKSARIGRPPTPQRDPRTHLLDAATRLFAERGIADTTLAQIAVAAGVTAAMVHYYFKSREQLLDAVMDERIAPIIDVIWAPIERQAVDPISIVPELVARVIACVESMPGLPSLWLREIINEGGQLRTRVIARIPSAAVQYFAMEIASAQRRRKINPDLEPRLVFISIFGLTMLLLATTSIRERLLHTADLDHAALARHITALLTDGLSGIQGRQS
jgi:TetR/AcrR family transcriptional regulator